MKKIKQVRGKRRTLVVNWVAENDFQVEVRTEDLDAEHSNIIVLPLPNSGFKSALRPPPLVA
jgi:hypothetical protein